MDPAGRQVFTVDLLERYAAKGRGVITCMAAGNDVILLGTSKGWVIRHDFGIGDSTGSFLLPHFLQFLKFNTSFLFILSNSIMNVVLNTQASHFWWRGRVRFPDSNPQPVVFSGRHLSWHSDSAS